MSLRCATAVIHAPGLSGTPLAGQFAMAEANASCMASSARSKDPASRMRVAIIRPDSWRNTVSTIASISFIDASEFLMAGAVRRFATPNCLFFLRFGGGHLHWVELVSVEACLLRRIARDEFASFGLACDFQDGHTESAFACHHRAVNKNLPGIELLPHITDMLLHQASLLVRHIQGDSGPRRNQLAEIMLFGHGTKQHTAHRPRARCWPKGGREGGEFPRTPADRRTPWGSWRPR